VLTLVLLFSINREILWRTYGGLTISFFLVGIVSLAGLLTGSYRGFWSFCLGMACFYSLYLAHALQQLYKVSKALPTMQVSLVLDENGVAFETDVSRLWLQWTTIKRVLRFKSGILVERTNGSHAITIPSDVLTEEASRFLHQSIKQAKLIKAKGASIQK
jgi:hypothetical protein